MIHKSLIGLLLFAFANGAISAIQLRVTERQDLFTLQEGGRQLVKAEFAFWGKDWKWAHQKAQFTVNSPYNYLVKGANRQLNFFLTATTKKTAQQQMTWQYELVADNASENVIGGGITFKLDLANEAHGLGEPVLLPDNRGWIWGDKNKKGIEVVFEPAVATVYFERNRKSEIRAFFYKGNIPRGNRRHTMTVTLYGDAKIKPTLTEQFDLESARTWPKDKIDWQTFPIDLSFLNTPEKPAGKRGFIRSSGEKLIFDDGTEALFWGTNITSNSLFRASKINISKQAKRLAAMGFNLVRFHHHDAPWANPNVFGDKSARDTQNLGNEALDKLDWWIKSLKDEGIYVWLDLHVLRQLKKADDIYAFEEIEKKTKGKGANLKGYNYVNPTIKDAMRRFNIQYVNHINPYTKLAYKDEPAIVAMLITNENDITHHFGNNLLPNKQVPSHNKIYMREAKVFAEKHGLPANLTWQSWRHGPSKLFLNDLEYRFNREMIDALRETGVKVPIVTTNLWGSNPMASLPALTSGNMIDVHSYGQTLELEANPLLAGNITSRMAMGQVADKPMSVTEWNISPFPAPDRRTIPLFVASRASHQGWDAIMQYAYAQHPLNKIGKPSNWHSHNDPSLLATLPAAALLYRSQHVQPAKSTYYLAPGSIMYQELISPETSAAIRTSSEKGRLLIGMPETSALPWLEPTRPPKDAIVLEDYRQSLINAESVSVMSDTGELYRNWHKGIYTINTSRSQVAMGWLGGKSLTLSNTQFKLDTDNATVAIQSLNEQPIRDSDKILISIGVNSVPYTDLKGRSRLPFLSQPITGMIQIQARAGLRLVAISNLGKQNELPVEFDRGWYRIDLNKTGGVHWLMLEKP